MSVICVIGLLCSVSALLVFSNSTFRRRLGVQGICRQFAASGDFVMSSVVTPTCAWNLYKLAHSGYPPSATPRSVNYSIESIQPLFTTQYLNAVGFFTALVILWDPLSLIVAAVDRFFIIRQPLRYSHEKAKALAARCIAVCAVFSIIVALLPIVLRIWRYNFFLSLIIFVDSEGAVVFLIVLISSFLLFLWSISIVSCKLSFGHAIDRGATDFTFEERLTRTLTIYVAVHTFLGAPLFISVCLMKFVHNVFDSNDPKEILQSTDFRVFTYISVFLFQCNGIIKFAVYNLRSIRFRRVLLQLPSHFNKKCRKIV